MSGFSSTLANSKHFFLSNHFKPSSTTYSIQSISSAQINSVSAVVLLITSKITTIMLIVQDYDEFDAKSDKLDYIHQFGYKIDNFDLIITIVNVSDLILYQIETLIVVYVITSKVCIFYDRILFEFNTGPNHMDLRAFHSTATENDAFNSIIILINRIIISIVQVDHSSVILIMSIHLLSIMLMDTFKMFVMLFDSNFCINVVENNFGYAFVHGRLVINAILLIIIVIVYQFYVRLCVLIHLILESTTY